MEEEQKEKYKLTDKREHDKQEEENISSGLLPIPRYPKE